MPRRGLVVSWASVFLTATVALGAWTRAAGWSTNGLQVVPREQLPARGTFWHAFGNMPPLPCPPRDSSAPVYALGNGQYLIGDTLEAWLNAGAARFTLRVTTRPCLFRCAAVAPLRARNGRSTERIRGTVEGCPPRRPPGIFLWAVSRQMAALLCFPLQQTRWNAFVPPMI